jgi:hypothetical protein
VEPDLAEMTARISPQSQLQSEPEPEVQPEPEPDLAVPDLAGLMARMGRVFGELTPKTAFGQPEPRNGTIRRGDQVQAHWSGGQAVTVDGHTISALSEHQLLGVTSAGLGRSLAAAPIVHARDPDAHLGGWTGGTVWEASTVLANFVAHCLPRGSLAGLRVLELSAGCGLPGMAAAAAGAAETVLTEVDEVCHVLRGNIDRNFGERAAPGRIWVASLSWGDEAQTAALCPPLDILLGSDLMYSPSMYPLLADTVAGLAGPRTTVYWSAQRRDVGVDVGFFDRLRAHGFSIVDLSACRDVRDGLPPPVAALLRAPSAEPADPTRHVPEADWPLFRANVSLFRMTMVGESADRTPE